MTRILASSLLVAAALVGCNRDGSMHSEQPSSNATAQSSQPPAQQSEEIAAQEERQEEAVEALPEQLDEAAAARQRATEEAGRLTLLVNQACEGIASEDKDVCPLDARHVRTVRDIDNGVAVQLNPNAGDVEALQHRVDCYSAIAQVRANEAAVAANPDPTAVTPATETEAAPAPRAECVLDVPTTTASLSRAAGGVRVELTSGTEGYALEIREQARRTLTRQRTARR